MLRYSWSAVFCRLKRSFAQTSQLLTTSFQSLWDQLSGVDRPKPLGEGSQPIGDLILGSGAGFVHLLPIHAAACCHVPARLGDPLHTLALSTMNQQRPYSIDMVMLHWYTPHDVCGRIQGHRRSIIARFCLRGSPVHASSHPARVHWQRSYS
jgi:hypothetical protein